MLIHKSDWTPKINKAYANKYLTPELIEYYKAKAEYESFFVSKVMYELMKIAGVLKKERQQKKIRPPVV